MKDIKKIPVREIRPRGEESPGRFKIRKVEELFDGNDMVQALHRHNYYYILALQKGQGEHEIDFTTYKISDHSVFILRPGQVHQLQLKRSSSGYLLALNTEYLLPHDKSQLQRLRRASSKNHYQPGNNRFEKLYAILEFIYREYTEMQHGHNLVIRSYLDIFFIELIRAGNGNKKTVSTTSYTQERFEEFQDLLEMHVATHKQVTYYMQLMNLSAFQLNAITKTATGKTCSDLINEQIILEAKRNLLATSSQVKDIADQLGYEDSSYFIRFFKKHTGYSPEDFRFNFR